VDGTVTSTKPLSYQGTLIDNIKVTFKDGKIIEAHASKGEEVLQKVLKSDEGASRIGEVALVPHSSPISQSGIIFYNTLFDENAASHIALGQCYSKCFKGELDLSKEEISKRGGNSSMIHIDWMIGSNEIDVDGIDQSGNSVPIFRQGEWVS
jgi:aminopeptidase